MLTGVVLSLGGCNRVRSHWTNISAGEKDAGGGSFAYDAAHDVLFVSAANGVLRCTAPGTKPAWTHMVGGRKVDYVASLCYDSVHNVLYAAAGSGVYSWAGPEGAGAWKTMNGVGDNFSLAYDDSGDVLYAGTRGGVYRCTNPASSPAWAVVDGGPRGATTLSLLYDSTRRVLFAGTDSQGIGVWKYQGGVWTNLDRNFSKSRSIGHGGALAYDSSRDILYTPGRQGILRCAKAATDPSWRTVGGVGSYYFSAVAIDTTKNVLYAGAYVPLPDNPYLETAPGATPKINQNSHGVFACANPDSRPAWTNTGGALSSKNIGDLAYDPGHRMMYAAAGAEGAWRYDRSTDK